MNDDEMRRLWCKLTYAQRLHLINQTVPYSQRVGERNPIVTGRVLNRLGLGAYQTNAEGRALAEWAKSQDYARQDGPKVKGWHYRDSMVPSWTFTSPGRGRIDPDRLTELVAEGHSAISIAKQFGLTRQAVSAAAVRQGLKFTPRPKKPATVRSPPVARPRRVVLCLSDSELTALKENALHQDLTVSAYLRSVALSQ